MQVILFTQLDSKLLDVLFRRLVHGGGAPSGSAADLLKGSKVGDLALLGQTRAAALGTIAPLGYLVSSTRRGLFCPLPLV